MSSAVKDLITFGYLLLTFILKSDFVLGNNKCDYGYIYNEGLQICQLCEEICKPNTAGTAEYCRKEPNCQGITPVPVQNEHQSEVWKYVLGVGGAAVFGFACGLVLCWFWVTKKIRAPLWLRKRLENYKSLKKCENGSEECSSFLTDNSNTSDNMIAFTEPQDSKQQSSAAEDLNGVSSPAEDLNSVAKDCKKLQNINPTEEQASAFAGHNPDFSSNVKTTVIDEINMEKQKYEDETELKTN